MRTSPEITHILEHHQELLSGLQERAQGLFDATEHLQNLDPLREELVRFLRSEILPHAQMEEHSFYAVGLNYEPTRLLVQAMQSEHERLGDLIDHLDWSRTTLEVLKSASALLVLFEAHLQKENEVLIPELGAAQLM